MLQIIRAIVRGRPRNGGRDTTLVDLIFANVNFEDILMKDDLDKLAAEDDGFRVYYVLNNPPEKWDGGVGFCTPDMIKVAPSLVFILYFFFIPRYWKDRHDSKQADNRSSTSTDSAPTPSTRHQDPHLWSPAHGQRYEESDRVARIREAEAGQQVG